MAKSAPPRGVNRLLPLAPFDTIANGAVQGDGLRPAEVLEVARALTVEDRMAFFAILDGRDESYLTLHQFIERAHQGFLWSPHLETLCTVLQDVVDGLRRRVMIFMPPRHGKSEMVSRLVSAYYLYRHPTRHVALTTYGAELSYELSEASREYYLSMGGQLASATKAKKMWKTAAGGMLWATGVGGPATGRGFHLGIIDDPYKDDEEASSAKIRRGRLNWYKSVFRTRAAPGAAIVVLMTRWHQDDLAANLLNEEIVARQGWHLVEMQAEKKAPPSVTVSTTDGLLADDMAVQAAAAAAARASKLPETVTREADARDHPVWLWTGRFPAEEYESVKREQGGDSGYYWNALFQQRPVSLTGGMFKPEWFQKRSAAQVPRFKWLLRWWDVAATEGGGKYTAGLLVGVTASKQYWILGLEHVQYGAAKRDLLIKATAKRDASEWYGRGPVYQGFPQDPGAAGKQVAQQFVVLLDGIAPVVTDTESGDKLLRATLPSSAAGNGQYFILDEPWAHVVLTELAAAGEGAEYMDIVDALSNAHAWLSSRRDPTPVQGSSSGRTLGR